MVYFKLGMDQVFTKAYDGSLARRILGPETQPRIPRASLKQRPLTFSNVYLNPADASAGSDRLDDPGLAKLFMTVKRGSDPPP